MSKKLEKQLEEYYGEIERLIPDPKDQKRALQGLKNNIRSYLKEKPAATFNEITSRYGKPDEIAEYYMPQAQDEETSEKTAIDPVKIFSLIGSVVVVGAIVVIAVLNRPNVDLTGANLSSSSDNSSVVSSELESSWAADESSQEVEDGVGGSVVISEGAAIPDENTNPDNTPAESVPSEETVPAAVPDVDVPADGVPEETPDENTASEETPADDVSQADSPDTEEAPDAEVSSDSPTGEIVAETNTSIGSRKFILDESSTRLLTAEDLEGLTDEELMLARNEIYARNGRMFNDPQLQNYFNSQDWYNGTISANTFRDSIMSEVESRNIDFIANFETNS